MRIIAVLIFVLAYAVSAPALAQDRAPVERAFQTWLAEDLWPLARQREISRQVFDASFDRIALNWGLPDLRPPSFPEPQHEAQSQAEFRAPSRYFREARIGGQAAIGRRLYAEWRETLERIEDRFGVPGAILLAIWGGESDFGAASLPYSAIAVLATKAFMSTRQDLFRGELLAALEILQRGDIQANAMMGSWAGALGQPQFMPSSFLEFAVDMDGDGRRDIWNSVPDTLASIANYLSQKGWLTGRDWGFEVRIPNTISCAQEGPDLARPVSEWVAARINRVSGRPFPGHELAGDGMMLVPAGRDGPHFVVTPNFYVIKEYNNSDLYALYIGNLADRIAYGVGAFQAPWGSQPSMLRSDIAAMQRGLEGLGYDVGGADGLPGFRTRRSIGDWQARQGRAQTCFPDPQTIRALR
jgi:lytic murein transglycosylase